MSSSQNKVGERIKNIRISKGLSMDDFGSLFDPPVTKGTISKWENGKYLPNNNRIKKIAEIAEISVEELLYGDIRNYLNPIIIEIAANQYNIDISDDQEMIDYIFEGLYHESYDSDEESLYSENKDRLDDILLYPFAMDSEGLIQTATLDLFHSMNKIKELTENRKDDLSKKEYAELTHTKDLITEVLQQAYYDIDGMDVDSHFSSIEKYEKKLQKEIDKNANTEILDPKIPNNNN
ncbi:MULTISPECIES: helix-turn-helix domain-containing protein [Vagococcus]|uniref:Transcriptional regulator, XRE family n=1 Tax=Vagococcus fluvialis bH819 TaxID=1255619 RepID=A0A1X6WM25_9ENTE|nr:MULTISPECIES: helix-turn-helix domain-containing protein [Vagococcus]SLM85393.1 Transcriptional regulator, XRE family [Vagococcus fluvialis bH819]HCM89313.1 helix-turn-helix domain-containing protein [Vagococcus sp.]